MTIKKFEYSQESIHRSLGLEEGPVRFKEFGEYLLGEEPLFNRLRRGYFDLRDASIFRFKLLLGEALIVLQPDGAQLGDAYPYLILVRRGGYDRSQEAEHEASSFDTPGMFYLKIPFSLWRTTSFWPSEIS